MLGKPATTPACLAGPTTPATTVLTLLPSHPSLLPVLLPPQAVIVGAEAESKPAAAAVSETKSAGHSIEFSKVMPSVSVTKTAEVVAPATFSKSVQVGLLQGLSQ